MAQAFGAAARLIADDFLDQFGITNGFLQSLAGQLADGTLISLVGQPGALRLLDAMAIGLLQGTIPMGWDAGIEPFLIQGLLNDPSVQIALGLSLGDGIGSLFGDNIFGDIVGAAAGAAATITIAVVCNLIRLIEAVVGAADRSPSAKSMSARHSKNGSDFFFEHATANDLNLTAALIRSENDANALHRSAATGGLELTDMGIAGPVGDQSQFLDVNMTFDAGGSHGSRAPLFVAFRFQLDRLFPASTPATPASLRYGNPAAATS